MWNYLESWLNWYNFFIEGHWVNQLNIVYIIPIISNYKILPKENFHSFLKNEIIFVVTIIILLDFGYVHYLHIPKLIVLHFTVLILSFWKWNVCTRHILYSNYCNAGQSGTLHVLECWSTKKLDGNKHDNNNKTSVIKKNREQRAGGLIWCGVTGVQWENTKILYDDGEKDGKVPLRGDEAEGRDIIVAETKGRRRRREFLCACVEPK